MKKLFIITGVGKIDSRYHRRYDMIGTVVRAELTSNILDPYENCESALLYMRGWHS